jgi:flagellar FliL protein
MAEATQQTATADPPPRPGGRKLLIIVALAVLALCGLGGGAAWWLGLFGANAAASHPAEPEAAAEAEAEAGHEAEPSGEDGHGTATAGVAFVDLPDVVVNLQSVGPRMRFLKLRVSLEAAGDHEAEQTRVLTPRIMDSFQLYLRSLTVEDVQGSVGMQRLKEGMLARVLPAVEPLEITDLLIKEMLVQ